jgi:hypothetical protein
MKRSATVAAVSLIVGLMVFGTSPLPIHPAAPRVPIGKALRLASDHVRLDDHPGRYCSHIQLDEGGISPAPRGSSRHWHLVFQDAGSARTNYIHAYVDMMGGVSDEIPSLSK